MLRLVCIVVCDVLVVVEMFCFCVVLWNLSFGWCW